MEDEQKYIELIPVEKDEHKSHRTGKSGRGRGPGRGHRREGYISLKNKDEEISNDSENIEEKEESLQLIEDKNKDKVLNRLLRKNSKDNEEIMKAEQEQKQKFVKQYGKCELIRKSLKFSLQNWKYQMYNQINTFIHQMFSIFFPASQAKLVTAITSTKNYDELKTATKNYLLIITIKLIISELMQYIAYKFVRAEAVTYRNLVMENIAEKDIEFFDIYKTGELKERISSSES